MKALVIGFGSIGKRHADILKGLGCQITVASKHYKGGYATVHEALRDEPDYVVIASRTSDHRANLSTLAGLACRVLVEKPLFADPAHLPLTIFPRAAVGYNLRFHPVIQALKKRLDEVKEAMGADEVIRATSAMARGEDPAMVELMEIVHKADMTDFSTVREFPGEKEGAPSVEAVVSDLVSAHRKGLMRYVKELRPTNAGMVVKLESRADALKAFISAKKAALDSMAKIRGLSGEEKAQAPTIILNILERLDTDTLKRMHDTAIEIEAEAKE